MPPIQIAPSILASDLINIETELKSVEVGADMIHMDIMDGHFVPNLTFGPEIVRRVKQVTQLPVESHLMVEDPEKFVDMFIPTKCDIITVHIEALQNQLKSIQKKLRDHNIRTGISLNPPTPITKILAIAHLFDLILVMSVHPGFAGQAFIPETLEKVKALVTHRSQHSLSFKIEIDGGISLDNISEVRATGVDIAVVGSGIFRQPNRPRTLQQLKISV